MTDKLVTHEDLTMLRNLRDDLLNGDGEGVAWMDPTSPRARLIDRLIAAAEADQPPLPEGWVVLAGEDGGLYPYWHMADRLYGGKGGDAYRIKATATKLRDRLTPLRPTVTEADVEKAAEAGHESEYIAPWSHLHADIRACFVRQLRVALDTLGIEVQP